MEFHPGWPFDVDPRTAVITLRTVLEGAAPVLVVSHDEDDGGWQFLDGSEPREEEARLVALSTVVELDPSLRSLADLPEGWIAWRESPAAPWHREVYDEAGGRPDT